MGLYFSFIYFSFNLFIRPDLQAGFLVPIIQYRESQRFG